VFAGYGKTNSPTRTKGKNLSEEKVSETSLRQKKTRGRELDSQQQAHQRQKGSQAGRAKGGRISRTNDIKGERNHRVFVGRKGERKLRAGCVLRPVP